MRLFVGDDWAEDHHDVEVMDEAGKVLARRRLPEGVAGIADLHGLVGAHLGEDADEAGVVVGIETDRGPWVTALIAAGYLVYPVNPLQASRYRERHGVSRAKSDSGDAHVLADMVRTDSHQLRPAAGDSPAGRGGQGSRAHAQDADLGADPGRAAAAAPAARVLSRRAGGIRGPGRPRHAGTAREGTRAGEGREADPRAGAAALKRARRRNIKDKTNAVLAALRGEHLGQPEILTAAYAATARSLIAVIATLNEQVSDPPGAGGGAFWPAPGR